MAIKPVTFQASKNFNSNLYALEVKSRFGDQSNANGYYTGYGDELDAIAVGATITIKKGAFLISGRMVEVTTDQDITISPLTNGLVGYVVARAETFHTDDEENVSFVFYLGSSLDSIVLTQQDIYASASETENMIYETPLYSFRISEGEIVDLVKVIKPIQEIFEMMSKVTQSAQSASEAQELAIQAQASATNAQASASEALRLVQQAVFEGGTVVTREGVALGELEISVIENEISDLNGDVSSINNNISRIDSSLNNKQPKFSKSLPFSTTNSYPSYGIGGLTQGELLAVVVGFGSGSSRVMGTFMIYHMGYSISQKITLNGVSYTITFTESYIGNNIEISGGAYFMAITILG